jgi:uncharacterized protein (TIGR02391 family)
VNETISVEFSEDELHFLDWAMAFLEGGPFDGAKELQREDTQFKVRKALSDQQEGILPIGRGRFFAVRCAFCEGEGVFPDILGLNDVETDPCPVCGGRGFNVFEKSAGAVLKCRFCGGDGRAWDSSGYATGEVCQVCHGTGVVPLEDASERPEDEFLWQLIHSRIAEVARSRFESGHYADSIEAALKEINSVVKEIVRLETDRELDGAALMLDAVSPKKPVIRIGDLSTETGRNVQQGYMQIYAGVMTGIRNPGAHENLEIDKSTASHLLMLASLLMWKLDERS